VHLQAEQEVNILRSFLLGGESWKVGVVNLAALACISRTTKKVVNFFRGKSVPQRKSWLPLWTPQRKSYVWVRILWTDCYTTRRNRDGGNFTRTSGDGM